MRARKRFTNHIDNCTYIFHCVFVEFEWDPKKSEINLHDRGLDFAAALPAFNDENKKIWRDDRKNYGELRYNMLAKCGNRIMYITFTLRSDVVRLISFRKANKREQRRYEET